MNKQPKYKIDNARLTRLVAKAQGGNQKALDEVVNMVSGYLYYYCLTLLGDEEQARDAVQDILLTMLKKLDTLADPKAFLGWLKTITANHCRTKLMRTRQTVSLDEGTWEPFDENDQICPEKSAETVEVCGYVREAVRALPQLLRESVLLFYFQQMTVRQIADVLEVNENTVKSRLYAGRQTMKKYLEQYGGAALASCSVPPLFLLSFSLIQGAERQKPLLIPYATPAGAVKMAAVNPAVGGSVSMKIAAVGAACIATIGGVSAFATAGMIQEQKPSATVGTTAVHHGSVRTPTTAPLIFTTAPSSVAPPVTTVPAAAGSNAEAGTQPAPTQAQQMTAPTAAAQAPTQATTAAAAAAQAPTQATTAAAAAATTTTAATAPPTTARVTVPVEQRKVCLDTSGLVSGDTSQVCCHIEWDGGEFYQYGTRNEYCTAVSDTLWSFDLAPLALEDGKTYYVWFYTMRGGHTEALPFTTADYGAVMLIERNPLLAPTDSLNVNYVAKWKE